jgi:uncharacterized protein
MHLKIHRSYRNVVAVCDEKLIGKKYEEGKFQLDLKENFFRNKDLPKEEVIKTLQLQAGQDSTFNIVGPESIQAALEAGIINEENISKIQDIPFALTLI